MTDADATEKARTRRRWLGFAEVATVLALVISAASFWDSHQEREESRRLAAEKPVVATAPLVLTAAVTDDEGGSLHLAAAGDDRVIQTQTVLFPSALAVAPHENVGDPRLDADWFADGLRRALADDRKSSRFPVGIITVYTESGAEMRDAAVYEIGHGWRSRLLQSDAPRLRGITLVARLGSKAGTADLQRRVDSRWKHHHPG